MVKVVSLETLVAQLECQLLKELPGKNAQMKMAPLNRFDFPEPSKPAKLSSVLILLYPHNNEVYTVLIKRASYNGHHSGQVSFPGGKFEKGDKSLIDTALRETSEEVGVQYKDVNVLGNISSLLIPVSNIMVLPIIGYTNKRPDFEHDPVEVNQIIEVSLNELLLPSIIKNGIIKVENRKIKTPYYSVQNQIIWGATAMIISEFLEILNR